MINLGIHGSDIATLRTNVTLWATTEDYETTSKRLKIRFLPNVFVLPEVTLAENSNAGELFVIGLREVLEQINVNFNENSQLKILYKKFLGTSGR